MGTVNIEPVKQNAVSMSSRQYSAMKYIRGIRTKTITVDEVASFHQNTLGSLVRPSRAYLTETRSKDALTLTPAGELALRAFEGADFFRTVNSFHFSSFIHLNVPNTEHAKRKPAAAKKTAHKRAAA